MRYAIALALLAGCTTPTQPIPFTVTAINRTTQPAFVIFTDGFTRTVTDTLRFTLDQPTTLRIYHADNIDTVTVNTTTTLHISGDRP